jgi:hypothetical protein
MYGRPKRKRLDDVALDLGLDGAVIPGRAEVETAE